MTPEEKQLQRLGKIRVTSQRDEASRMTCLMVWYGDTCLSEWVSDLEAQLSHKALQGLIERMKSDLLQAQEPDPGPLWVGSRI